MSHNVLATLAASSPHKKHSWLMTRESNAFIALPVLLCYVKYRRLVTEIDMDKIGEAYTSPFVQIAQ
ncbi:MAG: hypothetical protein NVS4B11_04060 [Ktedonobacteraceae bacterium]